jgi:hypothetical protein
MIGNLGSGSFARILFALYINVKINQMKIERLPFVVALMSKGDASLR